MRNQDAAREALVERVLPIHDAENFRVVLVLDSRQAFSAFMHAPEAARLECVYAPADLSADGAIEKMLARLKQPEQAIVVSHDRWVRESTLVQGAQAMRPAELLSGRIVAKSVYSNRRAWSACPMMPASKMD